MAHRKYELVEGFVCGTCKYYCQHYIRWKDEKRFSALDHGHCIYPRVKNRRPDQTCPHWTPVDAKK